jgi:uncharacterized protein (TIRG00374 family)
MARLKLWFRWIVSIGLVVVIARKVNWTELGSILRHIDWRWATAGSLLTGLLIGGLAFRWKIFLEQQRIEVPFPRLLSLTWAGQFFNSLLPGSTGGDVFKIYQMCRMHPERKAAAASSVLLDRLSALVALLTLAAAAFLLAPTALRGLAGERFERVNVWWGIGLLALVLVAGRVAFRLLRFASWTARLKGTVSQVIENFRPSWRGGFALLLAFGIHLLNFLIIYFLARSLGIQIGFGQVLLMMPVVLLLVMLPITINGHGLREVLLIAYFSAMSIRLGGRAEVDYRSVAVALSILMVANDLIWSLPGGLGYLVRGGSSEKLLTVPTT